LHSLPTFLRIRGRPVLVVGGGRLAERRVAALLAAGAKVLLVASELTETLSSQVAAGVIDHAARGFIEGDIADQCLVFALSDDADENSAAITQARSQGIWCNSDSVDDSDFLLPAVVDRSPLLIALSSGGESPALTRLLRVRMEAMVPAAYGRLAALIARYRERAARGRNRHQRRQFWDNVLAGPVAERLFAGRDQEAAQVLEQLLENDDLTTPATRGEVYLVGGGPGDPDLLTFRALRLMQQADVVLYDSLIAPAIVDLVRTEAERIHVGKRASRHTLPQDDINQLMVDLARKGKRVLRLKGGDPFVFGRGGEEIGELADAGIPFQVVPGITAANGCAAYAGIPLTHRDYAQSVQFVTGHVKEGELELDWPRLTSGQQTVVFFMGRAAITQICARLIQHGLPKTHPAALVIDGTTPRQRVLVGDLESLPGLTQAQEISGPSLLIVGEVVRLNEKLGWFFPVESELGQ